MDGGETIKLQQMYYLLMLQVQVLLREWEINPWKFWDLAGLQNNKYQLSPAVK